MSHSFFVVYLLPGLGAAPSGHPPSETSHLSSFRSRFKPAFPRSEKMCAYSDLHTNINSCNSLSCSRNQFEVIQDLRYAVLSSWNQPSDDVYTVGING